MTHEKQNVHHQQSNQIETTEKSIAQLRKLAEQWDNNTGNHT